MSPAGGPALSVVVPTLDEAHHLPRLLEELRALGDAPEVVIVDGGSRDGTAELARAAGARVVETFRGRGRQLRAGAEAARGRWLLFLHADSRLDPSAARAVLDHVAAGDENRAAYFRFALDATGWWWHLVEAGQRIRERVTGLVYGDQGLLVSRSLYRRSGGHPGWPLMEDVAVVDRIRAAGRLERLPHSLPTSPRRYRREGPVRACLRNTVLITLFRLGVSPHRLLRWYGAETARARTLLVFAKAPRPGSVKTRLAAAVGDDEAARIYRALGRGVVDAVRHGPWRTVVSFAPADARDEMEAWLGGREIIFRPQSAGDLGERMDAALREAFRSGADAACVVGTDAPGVDAALVERAFRALEESDVVLGPAEDGGYYLVALDRPRPELFRGMAWSTPEVLAVTRARIQRLGLREKLLPTLRDVDRVDDVPSELRRR